jgi:uncharacterized membrane protein YagU involved in acid resistance
MTRTLAAALRPGILAGLAGGVLLDAYLLAVGALSHRLTPEQLYTYIASGLVGKGAYAWPGMLWLGLVVHLLVSIGWGVAYAYVAVSTPQVAANPVISGTVYGLVVFVMMQIVQALAGIWRPPSFGEAFTSVVAHVVFFGLPVAFVVARRLRPA